MGRGRTQQALVAEATEYLEELEAGEIDDTWDAVQAIDEYLGLIDDEHVELREALNATRSGLLGERPRGKARRAAPKRATRPASRTIEPGTKLETDADRVGTASPFELTFAYRGELRRISTLRAHMRWFFRVPKRDLLAELGAIFDELVAASEPFEWLQNTTSQLYSRATPSSIARARARFACPAGSSCHIALKSAELADDAAERRLEVSIHPRGSTTYTSCPSSLHLTFPPTAMDGAFRDRFVDLCARLPALLCATAGYFLDTTIVRPAAAKQIMTVALRHRGVELPGTTTTANVATSWICGVNWLTAIGAGARAVLGKDLRGPAIALHRAGDAVVIQAGPRPELGEDGIPPATYRRVHEYLDRPSTLVGLATAISDPRVNDWHRRFTSRRAPGSAT